MDLGLFFDNFEIIAAAPNGVKKLRELILQLAVRGKLVAQDPADEPAGKLLERIRGKAEKLIKDKKIKNDNDLLIIKESEPTYKVPQAWTWTRLGAIVDYNGSSKVSPDSIPEDAWLLELEDIEKDTSRILQRLKFKERDSKSTKAEFQKGDVLYGKLRPYLNKVVMADGDGFCTTEIIPMRVHLGVIPEYLMTVLKSQDFINYVNAKSYGVKMPRLGTEDGRRALIPLPPIAEQKRIVAKVDELMKLCDTLETQQQQTRSHLTQMQKSAIAQLLSAPDADTFAQYWQDIVENFELLFDDGGAIGDLRQAILQLAVQGKLVRQDDSDESVSSFLEKMQTKKAQLKTSKLKSLDSVDSSDIPYELPSCWQWLSLGHLVESMNNGLYKPSEFYSDDGVACVRMFNIQDGQLNLREMKRVIVDKTELKTYRLKIGDLIVNRVNSRELVGKAALVEDIKEPIVYEAMNIRVRFLHKEDLPSYINLLFRTDRVRAIFQGDAKQASGQASVSQPQVSSVAVPLPPLAEQKRIVTKVNQLMKLCDTLQTHLTQRQTSAIDLAEVAVRQVLDRD
jgi:type I restriction enzyme, S subunit